MEIRLLGSVEVWDSGRRVEAGPPQRRAVLAALASDAGRPVSVDVLVERVWGQTPPARVRAAVHTNVTLIRRVLQQLTTPTTKTEFTVGLVRSGGGYVLQINPDQVDLHRFRRLTAAGRDRKRPADERAGLLRDALDLWRGPALTGLTGDWPDRMRGSWDGERLDAAVAWTRAELLAGRHEQVIPAARALAAEYPHAEPLMAVLMQALASTGRDAEALDFYGACRTRLVEELGAEPGLELRATHEAVLRSELVLTSPASQLPAPPGSGDDDETMPRQLPADMPGFAGRGAQLAQLDALLAAPSAEQTTAVVVCAVSGTAGVGKTALAVHWAHQVAHRFPDGQLYVNLRGFHPSGQVMAPAAAVRGFLDALGVPAGRVPAGLDAQTALYRSLLTGRRMLVVLDNARDAEQVRPLLPGSAGCLVVVTSRDQLTALMAADGAHSLTLGLLSRAEARELLARRLGPSRVTAEPEAVEQIITCCARLPLALSIAAARAVQTGFPLTAIAAELADTHRRLDALDAGDPATRVQAVFSWSYQALTPPAARLFRLLGLHPGPDTTAAAAASLASLPPPQAARLLAELTRASLAIEHAPGRYGFHDLLVAYAAGLAHTTDPEPARHAAVTRLLDHYTHTAHTAERLLDPPRDPIQVPLTPPAPGTTPEQLADHQRALDWLTAEHPVLLAALRLAAATGADTRTWQLAWALDTFLNRQGHWHDAADAWRAAVTAADHFANPTAAALAHRNLALAAIELSRYGEASTHLHRALDLHTQAGDRAGQAHAHHALGLLWERRDRPGKALGHAEQAFTLYQAAGHDRGQADALNAVGWCHALLGEHTQALTRCEQALTLHQRSGNLDGQAHTWDSLGYAHHHLTQHTQAADCYQHALTLFRGLGDRYNEAVTLSRLGDTQLAAGDPAAARATWTRALRILTDLGRPDTDTIRSKLNDLNQPSAVPQSCVGL